ncbi:HlyD family secretion protein [Urbifossiella limnaea]|uniref:HlyD family secretion protein n=1 Tax=Urbifossiella limnaea TaxID=2528023 RepID=A0A517Y1Q7_9BACT|nr:HlyD family efflux transporter periplasmic adaptor subunit [Urbifossiella limnaea]QDU23695.1 HlyD family secretion protein [Urbifossiella limnaea]
MTAPAFSPAVPFASLDAARTPRPARWVGRLLLLTFVAAPLVLVFVPWQQTVRGRGQIVAFAPTERKQVVTALVGGQVKKWYVVEGSKVKAGDPIVDIDDNDPGLAERLDAQRKFLFSRKDAATDELAEQLRSVKAQEQAMDAAVAAAKANRDAAALLVDVSRQARKNNEFAATFEKRRYEMFDRLFRDKQFGGLESELSRDDAKAKADRALTDVTRADAELKRAEAAVLTADSLVLQAGATGLSAVALAHRDLHRAEQNRFSVERELQEIENRIERFKARFVRAPTDGVIFRISANAGAGGQFVKEGDELAVIVPDATDRVVELLVDGVDAPLIAAHMEQTGRGPHVRLQFEGWPGVQFAGWPSVAIGTFGGRVRQIDATDDGNGRFRILVEPDELFAGDRWPEGLYLRQGNQAVGWVFLNRVTLGYELWRQLNGFPPVVAPKPPDKDESKPPKVKTK